MKRAGACLVFLTLLAASEVGAGSFTVIIAGLGGEPEYEQRFREQAAALAAAAEKFAGGPAHVALLSGESARRDAIRRRFQSLAEQLGSEDTITVVLIGHGSFDGEEYRFNVPGHDLTGSELARLFNQLPAREQLIVNASSASGATLELWQRPGRIVVTATKSGGERTATRFGQYWVQAVTGSAADVNRDGSVTAKEAFDYAQRQVAAAFKVDVALATEHARLSGEEAAHYTVARLDATPGRAADPAVAALLVQRGAIERDLAQVKDRRASLSENEYYDALEGVLVRLALLQKQIDAQQAAPR